MEIGIQKPILSAVGSNGVIELYENKITIKRKGFSSFILQGLKGDKDIYINQISSIQLKKPNWATKGYVQFSFLGGHESKSGIFNATQDENTVMFDNKHLGDFATIKTEIEQRLFPNKTQITSTTNFSDLEKLNDLKNKGIITDEEFNAKKKQILNL